MDQLRNIAVYVMETRERGFTWGLNEQIDGAWVDIEVGAQFFAQWMEAFDAGCVALFKLVPDERNGPRTPLRPDGES